MPPLRYIAKLRMKSESISNVGGVAGHKKLQRSKDSSLDWVEQQQANL